MIVTVVRDHRGNTLVLQAKPTRALIDRLGLAFTDLPQDAFSLKVRETFPCQRLRAYRVNHQRSHQLLTFSRIQNPRCLSYRGLETEITNDDRAPLTLDVRECQTVNYAKDDNV